MIMSNNTALVEGINISTKHVKASTGAKQTGLVQQESPIHISNLIFKEVRIFNLKLSLILFLL